MKLSEDTEKALEFLDYTTGNNLRKRSDLGAILEIGATYGCSELVNDLIFYGAACWNLSLTLKKEAGRENEAKLKIQLDDLAGQLERLLVSLAGQGDVHIQKRFKDIYFSPEHGSFKNLLDLAHDLAGLKSLQKRLRDMPKD